MPKYVSHFEHLGFPFLHLLQMRDFQLHPLLTRTQHGFDNHQEMFQLMFSKIWLFFFNLTTFYVFSISYVFKSFLKQHFTLTLNLFFSLYCHFCLTVETLIGHSCVCSIFLKYPPLVRCVLYFFIFNWLKKNQNIYLALTCPSLSHLHAFAHSISRTCLLPGVLSA